MTAFSIDSGVVRWSVDGRPAHEDAALEALTSRPLLVLMHGYGSSETDLSALAPHLPHGFVCASLRAPLRLPAPYTGAYAWWHIPIGYDGLPARQPDPPQFVGSEPHLAALAVLDWIDALETQVSEGDRTRRLGTIALLGFSQGGCMVTSLLRLRPSRFVCGVNCSGFVAPGAYDGDAELATVRPPLFWGRDEADPIIDAHRIALTQQWAPAHTALESKLYEGMLHSISPQELRDINRFLVRNVPSSEGNVPSSEGVAS